MHRMIIGISGASGAPLALSFLRKVKQLSDWETHLILTEGGRNTLHLETALSENPLDKLSGLADYVYRQDEIGSVVASGSFHCDAMVIIPCSMKTLAGIACGYSDNLLLRAADVMLKERRLLILVTRETPLSRIHLQNMLTAAEAGAVILPPVMTYYHQPESIADMENQIIGKVLDLCGVDISCYGHWNGTGCDYHEQND